MPVKLNRCRRRGSHFVIISLEELKTTLISLMKIARSAESLTNYKLYNFHLKSSATERPATYILLL